MARRHRVTIEFTDDEATIAMHEVGIGLEETVLYVEVRADGNVYALKDMSPQQIKVMENLLNFSRELKKGRR